MQFPHSSRNSIWSRTVVVLVFAVAALLALAVLASTAVAQAPGENAYCAVGDKWNSAASDGPAALPESCIYTGLDGTPSPGKIAVVQPGPNVNGVSVITQALQAATCGDTIELVAGQTYLPFVLPAKNCDAAHWITIRTNAPDTALPLEGTRINPSYAGVPSLADRPAYSGGTGNVMARIQTPKTGAPITGAAGANYYRLGPGLEITRVSGSGQTVYDMANISGTDHIIFDRVWCHGSERYEETNTCVLLTASTNVAVINSYLNSFKCKQGVGQCTDSHTLAGGDGIQTHAEGTWKIYNNFLEAAGENIMFGGGLHGNEVPMDIEIRQNHFYKPLSWHNCTRKVSCYVVKNLFEIKNASRVLLEGNLMEGSWGGYSQSGFAILLDSRGSWGHVEDITIRYSHISHVGNGFQLAALPSCDNSWLVKGKCPTHWADSAGAGHWSLHDILVDDVQGAAFGGRGNQAAISSYFTKHPPLHDLFLDHITFVSDPTDKFLFTFGTSPSNPQKKMGQFTYTNSIIRASDGPNIWQIGGKLACAVDWNPIATFNDCFTESTVTNNVIVGWPAMHGSGPPRPTPLWPGGNFTPADYSTVFVQPAPYGGDYHTLPPYVGIGADIDTLNAYLADVE